MNDGPTETVSTVRHGKSHPSRQRRADSADSDTSGFFGGGGRLTNHHSVRFVGGRTTILQEGVAWTFPGRLVAFRNLSRAPAMISMNSFEV